MAEFKHTPVLNSGEVDEIEAQFRYSQRRTQEVIARMLNEGTEDDRRAAQMLADGAAFVKQRHDEIVQHLRNDLNGIKRQR